MSSEASFSDHTQPGSAIDQDLLCMRGEDLLPWPASLEIMN
jgi:hypothetical protein